MKTLKDLEEKEAILFFEKAAELAENASCLRDKCGSIIVSKNEIIGYGFNSPPGNLESQRRCINSKEMYHSRVKDKTCCIHAEQRAVINALEKNPSKIKGSKIYFMRLDKFGKMTKAGKPYCTLCSKIVLDAGVSEFILWHEEGIVAYTAEEYNQRSFEYQE